MDSAFQHIHTQALDAINSGRYRDAENLCHQLLNQDKTFSDAWFLKAMSHAGRLDIRTAVASVIEALKLSPNNTEYLAQFAKFCNLLGENRRALLAADHAMHHAPQQALSLDTIGVVYTKLGEYQKARTVLKKAVEKDSKNSQFHFNLASAEQFLGNAERAEHHYLQAINYQPNFARAYWALSELTKNTTSVIKLEQLETLLGQKGISDDDELYLCHALAREKEKLGDYQAAFEYLHQGKFRYRAKLNYSWVVDERLFGAIERVFPLDTTSNSPNGLGDEAIFVLGMPRSGTTVLERILSSHSRVESLGELQNFALAVKQESNTKSSNVLDPAVVERTSTLNMHRIGDRYLKSLHNRDPEKAYFVDKTPLNFLQLGYIAESLPSAKIVLVRRNPMDTCLSNYRQLFAVSFSYYNYHYDLVDTGHYFRLFDQLMKKWLELYGDRVHVVDYESLVENPEDELKSLLEYCKLDWESACLEFHKNESAVATASAMQVREPLYDSSIARWKNYRDQLAPLSKILDDAAIDYE